MLVPAVRIVSFFLPPHPHYLYHVVCIPVSVLGKSYKLVYCVYICAAIITLASIVSSMRSARPPRKLGGYLLLMAS